MNKFFWFYFTMTFINYFSILCRKTLSRSVKIVCNNSHYCVIKHNLDSKNSLKYCKKKDIFIKNYAKFHLSVSVCIKSFQDTENEYAHKILQRIPAYVESTVKQPSTVNIEDYSKSKRELFDFAKVTMHCMSLNINLEEGPFSLPVSNLIKCLPCLSDEDILKCLFLLCCLPPTYKTWTPNFKALWNSLDSECVRRLRAWDTSQKLLVADYWFHLRLNRISQYNRNMIIDLLRKLNELSDTEVVQIMFYINLQREVPFNFSLKILENRLKSVIKSSSIDELGIVCLGYFKTKSKLHDISIIKVIIERFINEIEVAELITLVSLLKFLKKSMQLSHTELYIPLLHKCTSHTSKWDVHTCIHLALLASECHVYHPLLLDSITQRISTIIKSARLKDLMKLLQCLSHFNHHPPKEFSDLLFSEIHEESRQFEISNQPRVLIYIALYYSYIGYYNYDLLNIVLDKNYAKKCILTFPETELTFAEVDCSTEIECKDYTGNRLGKDFWKILEKRRGNINVDEKKPNAYTRLMNDILSALTIKEKTHVRHVLPHVFLPDILIQLSGVQKISVEDFLFLPPKDEVWVCIVIGVPFSFAYRSKQMTGITAMKIRQLEELGYKAIFVPHYELPRDIHRRKKYLEKKLNDCSNLNSFSMMN